MADISLVIHCELDPLPFKEMLDVWRQTSKAHVALMGREIPVLRQSPPCVSYAIPRRSASQQEGAK